MTTNPHLAVPDGGAVLRQPEDVQVHVVLSPSPQAEAETLVVPLEVHGVELCLLRGGERDEAIRTELNRAVVRGGGHGVNSKLQHELPQRWLNTLPMHAKLMLLKAVAHGSLSEDGARAG